MEKILIAGLGNPGKKYLKTRHNIGFMVLDYLAYQLNTQFTNESKGPPRLLATTLYHDKKLFLLKPMEFMNNSGRAISYIVNYFDIPLDKLLVIHDDMDIDFGKIKLVRKGGHGGHNGIRSIMELLGSKNFPRLKIGIGRPRYDIDPRDYVLDPFSKDQQSKLDEIIKVSSDAALFFAEKGIDAAMNRFNGTKID